MGTRQCADCGHRATARARFCEQCGAALTPDARPLRAPRALEAKILSERTEIEGERKQVTVMYTDIVGSTDLSRTLDPERYGVVLDRFLAISADAVHAYEGTVNQFTGDGLLAVFGAPLAHEDHAQRACMAVLRLQREVAQLAADTARADGVEFAIRCGLNSGEVIVGAIGDDVHMDFVPIGSTTALGKRIESLAPVGSIAISASTAALVQGEFELRELGEFELKGVPARQRVLELVGPGRAHTRLAATAATRGLSPFVGRDAESAQLKAALEDALTGNGRAIGIVGDPGVGKSRLVHEFVAACAARGLTVYPTGGLAHGRYVPLLAVLALFRVYYRIGEHDAPEIARERITTTTLALDPASAAELPLLFELLGVPDPDRPQAPLDPEARQQQLLALTSRVVKARSRREPAVHVIEDLQWIDDASAAFVEQLVAAVAGTRTLVVATYRPEYEAAWASSGPHAEISVGPLDGDATDDLLSGLLGHDDSLDGLAALIETRAGGNPFFIEEIVQALAENGHLTGARGRYRLDAELQGVVLPPTVQAALAARIDRLPSREKALVQTMSVIGGEIPGPLLRAVSDLPERQLADAVAALARAQMVIPRDSSDSREYAFKHPLTQEVAYRSQLSGQQARTHRAVAAALERIDPAGLDERAALLAHHCEASGDALAAAGWHARAAAWAEVASPADSMRHWRRVRDLTRDLEASPERDELAMKAGAGILGLGWRLGISPEESAALHIEGTDAERFRRDLYYAGSLMHGGSEREGLDGFRAAARQALAGGDRGRALTASTGVAYASWIAGSLSEAAETIDRALAQAGGDPTLGSGIAFVCPLAHAFGDRGRSIGYMGDLDAARRNFQRAIGMARDYGDPETESAAYANLALLEAEAGDVEAARDNALRGLAIAEPAANAIHIIACTTPAALAEVRAGRFADALARAETNLTTIRERQIGLYYEPLLLATIARAELALGKPRDALVAAEEAVEIMHARGLRTCALLAPITLARILLATHGAAAGERIAAVLTRALSVARESHARVYVPPIHRELAALARLRGDDIAAAREQAEADRVLPTERRESTDGDAIGQ